MSTDPSESLPSEGGSGRGVTGSSGSSTTRSVIFESEVSGEPGVTL